MIGLLLLVAVKPLESQFAAIAKTVSGKLGVYARVVETGVSAGLNQNDPFPTQSVYKVPIALAVFEKIRHGDLKLDSPSYLGKADMVPRIHSPIRDAHPEGTPVSAEELMRLAVEESDGTASDRLMELAGGSADINRYLSSIGLKDFKVAVTERRQLENDTNQYFNSTTPLAAAKVMEFVLRDKRLLPEHRSLMLKWMTRTTTFPGRIKGLLPKGTVVAHKTGSSFTKNGFTAVTNDVGLVTLPSGRHVALAVLLRDSRASDKERDAAIAKVAKAAFDVLGHGAG